MSKIKIIALLLALIITLSGCAAVQDQGPAKNTPDINPKAESANKDTSKVTLYYSYRGQQLLAGETRSIDVPVSEKLEKAVIRALIGGPSADRDQLVGLFWDGVKLVNVTNNEDILFVTLSEEFISTEPKTPVLDEETVGDRRKLAIYSIVNTITEMGTYSSVQFYVESKSGNQRILGSDVGFEDTVERLDRLNWENRYILTPEKTLEEVLGCYIKNNWAELYDYTAYTNLDGTVKPDREVFTAALAETAGNSLDTFKIVGVNVASDGQTAKVFLDYTMKTRNGDIPRSKVAVILVREEEIWKISYSSVVNVLINVG
jgi:uncharacterized protein YceK